MRALVLAGGQGTRLRPLTDRLPKPLLPFMGEPFALGQLRRLATAGVTHATFLVGADPAPFAVLRDAAASFGVEVDVLTEETALDTAGAARRAMTAQRDGAVLVCNGDVLTDLDYATIVAAHDEAGAAATLTLTRVTDTSTFGVVVRDPDGRVERFVEKPALGTLPDDTVNAGTYVLAADAFDGFPGDGPLSFERAVFPGLLDAGRRVIGVVSDAHWADLGTPDRYLAGHRAVLDGRCDWPIAPDLVAHAPTVLIASAARVGEGARLSYAVVGPGCEVGAGVELSETVLHEGAAVGEGARLHRCILGPGAVVEPNASYAEAVIV